MQANGGRGYSHATRGGGGGSGGRIALYYDEGFFDGVLQAAGGLGTVENGAAGTVYVEQGSNSSALRSLLIDNSGRSPETSRVNEVIYVTALMPVIICRCVLGDPGADRGSGRKLGRVEYDVGGGVEKGRGRRGQGWWGE